MPRSRSPNNLIAGERPDGAYGGKNYRHRDTYRLKDIPLRAFLFFLVHTKHLSRILL